MASVEVEVFACERYRPLAGWSADYLLPTDQHAYRVRGKKGGWTKLSDAEEALLAPGWSWEQVQGPEGMVAWEVNSTGLAVDTDGWSYGVNFTSSYEGSSKGGLQMMARWRRLVRTQTFSGSEQLENCLKEHFGEKARISTEGCPNVDLTFSGEVGRQLLEGVATASLYGDWNLPAFAKLKWQLAERLAGAAKGADKITTIEELLTDFISSQKPMTSRFAEVFKGSSDAEMNARIQEVESRFPQSELDAYASITVRRFRSDQTCGFGRAEHDCAFRAVFCGNCGCAERCSAKRLNDHDAICSFKKVACSKCGEEVPRGEMRGHATAACPLREASCNFAAIGCNVSLTHQQVAAHLEECSQAHMLILLNTVVDQQATIRSLLTRIDTLEARNNAAETRVASLEGKLGAAESRSSQELAKTLKDAAAHSDKKANAVGADARKHSDSAVASLKKELLREIDSVKAHMNGLDKKVEPIVREHARR